MNCQNDLYWQQQCLLLAHEFADIKAPLALQVEIKNLLARREDQIDTSEIGETGAKFWMNAKRPNLYKPTKQPVTLRLDSDLVLWFKEHTRERGYQTEINRVLWCYVTAVQKKAG